MTKHLEDLTDLQLMILGVLWNRGEATAHEVHEALESSTALARGTIGTLLHRLEKQRILVHRIEGREYYYRPAITREAVRAARVRGLVGGLFEGDVAAMVSFAVSKHDVDRRGLAQIREIIDQRATTRRR